MEYKENVNKFEDFTPKSKKITVILIILTICSAIFIFICGVNIIHSAFYSDNISITGRITDYNVIRAEGGVLYQPLVEFKYQNKTYHYTSSSSSFKKPTIGGEYKISFNPKTKLAESGEPKDYIFLLTAILMFSLIPAVFICIIKNKVKLIDAVMGLTFTLISFSVILYFAFQFNTYNPIVIITSKPFSIIVFIMLFIGISELIYAFKNITKRPTYIKIKLSKIENNIAFFDGGWRTGWGWVGQYQRTLTSHELNENIFEIGKTYKVNILNLRNHVSDSVLNLSNLKTEDFLKINT